MSLRNIALAVFLGLSTHLPQPASLLASDIHQDIRNKNTEVWSNGGVCRHASASVWRLATEKYGLKAKNVFWMVGPGKGHVIPVVEINNKWCHVRDERLPGWYNYSSYTACRDKIMTDENWLEVFTGRNVVKGTVRVVDAPFLSWMIESVQYERQR